MDDNEDFIAGREYQCITVGDHLHWKFRKGEIYTATDEGLVDGDGDACWVCYTGMEFKLIEQGE